jgi:hypothetical protein
MKKNLMKAAFFIGLVTSLSQCSEVQPATSPDPGIVISEKQFQPQKDIDFTGDYLVFRTPQLFEQTLNSIRNADPRSVRSWSDQLGFVSMRVIYEKALEEQEKKLNELLAQYQAYSPNDARLDVAPIFEQPAFVKENKDLLIFREKGMIARPKVPNYAITALINKNGLVKVAGHLFQYNEDNVKIIVGGDQSKIELLPVTNETNKKLNIIVNPITRKFPAESSNGRYNYSWSAKSKMFLDPTSASNQFYYNTDVSIISTNVPVYDTTPVCEPAGCGEVRAMDCTCYFPIIGYVTFTTFESHMEVRKVWLGLIDTAHQPSYSTITVDYKIDNGAWSNDHTYTSLNLSNTYITLYDGSPYVNFSCGNHDFYAHLYSSITSPTVNHLWCD